jgi:hypothetical protein
VAENQVAAPKGADVSGFADDGIMSNEIVGRHRLIAGDRVASRRLGADRPGGRESPESGLFSAKSAQSRSSVLYGRHR